MARRMCEHGRRKDRCTVGNACALAPAPACRRARAGRARPPLALRGRCCVQECKGAGTRGKTTQVKRVCPSADSDEPALPKRPSKATKTESVSIPVKDESQDAPIKTQRNAESVSIPAKEKSQAVPIKNRKTKACVRPASASKRADGVRKSKPNVSNVEHSVEDKAKAGQVEVSAGADRAHMHPYRNAGLSAAVGMSTAERALANVEVKKERLGAACDAVGILAAAANGIGLSYSEDDIRDVLENNVVPARRAMSYKNVVLHSVERGSGGASSAATSIQGSVKLEVQEGMCPQDVPAKATANQSCADALQIEVDNEVVHVLAESPDGSLLCGRVGTTIKLLSLAFKTLCECVVPVVVTAASFNNRRYEIFLRAPGRMFIFGLGTRVLQEKQFAEDLFAGSSFAPPRPGECGSMLPPWLRTSASIEETKEPSAGRKDQMDDYKRLLRKYGTSSGFTVRGVAKSINVREKAVNEFVSVLMATGAIEYKTSSRRSQERYVMNTVRELRQVLQEINKTKGSSDKQSVVKEFKLKPATANSGKKGKLKLSMLSVELVSLLLNAEGGGVRIEYAAEQLTEKLALHGEAASVQDVQRKLAQVACVLCSAGLVQRLGVKKHKSKAAYRWMFPLGDEGSV